MPGLILTVVPQHMGCIPLVVLALRKGCVLNESVQLIPGSIQRGRILRVKIDKK